MGVQRICVEDLLELADSVATNHKLRVDDQMHVPVLA